MERTSAGEGVQRRCGARYAAQVAAFAVFALERWETVDEHLRVWMFWLAQELSERAGLHQSTRVHDAECVDKLRHQANIVTDKQNRGAEFFLEFGECLHDLALNYHVERRSWFVGNNNFGSHRDGDGNRDALFHTPAEFVGVHVADLLVEPDFIEEFRYEFAVLR